MRKKFTLLAVPALATVTLALPATATTPAAPANTTPTVTTDTATPRDEKKTRKNTQPEGRTAKPSRSQAPYRFGTVPYNQWYAYSYMNYKYKWGKKHRTALKNLWTRESGWSQHAHNASSGAHGIPQALPGSKMRTQGSDWRHNPETQIRWGLQYIKERYGNPTNAWQTFQRQNWY